jgi:hypothetical protein
LKSSVKNEPYELIKNLKATNENLSVAWLVLEERYQHKRKVFETNFKAILDLPTLTYESFDSIKKMLDIYKSHMYAIEAQGIPVDDTQPFVIYLLTQKFDSATRKHWAEELKGKKELPTKEQFTSFLEVRIAILEGLKTSQNNPQEFKKFQHNSYSQNHKKPFNRGHIIVPNLNKRNKAPLYIL